MHCSFIFQKYNTSGICFNKGVQYNLWYILKKVSVVPNTKNSAKNETG